jgi:hypothetical protein
MKKDGLDKGITKDKNEHSHHKSILTSEEITRHSLKERIIDYKTCTTKSYTN